MFVAFLIVATLLFSPFNIYSDEIYLNDKTAIFCKLEEIKENSVIIKTDSDKKEIQWNDILCIEKENSSGKSSIELPPFKKSISFGLNGSHMFVSNSNNNSVGIFAGYMPLRNFEFSFNAQLDKSKSEYLGYKTESQSIIYDIGVNYYFFPVKKNYLDWARSNDNNKKLSKGWFSSSGGLKLNPLKVQIYTGLSAGLTETKTKSSGYKTKSSKMSYTLTLFGINYYVSRNSSFNWNMKITLVPPVESEDDLIYAMTAGIRFKLFIGK